MVTGHLREQNGYFQMILTWKDASGKRRSKSISTGLTVKGNKKRAENGNKKKTRGCVAAVIARITLTTSMSIRLVKSSSRAS